MGLSFASSLTRRATCTPILVMFTSPRIAPTSRSLRRNSRLSRSSALVERTVVTTCTPNLRHFAYLDDRPWTPEAPSRIVETPQGKERRCGEEAPFEDPNRRSGAGGRRELISVIQDGNTVSKILDHVGIPSEPPRFEPARAPPEEQWLDDSWD